MRLKRLIQTIILNTKITSVQRANYLKKVFAFVGENVAFQPRIIPLYPELIKLHNNVTVAANVHFITHDAIHNVLNNLNYGETPFSEFIGCIEIMDNVFIGSGTTILYNVKIGSNVVIGANTLVTKDLESNSVYAGAPAKKICSFDKFVAKRKCKNNSITNHNQNLTIKEVENAWKIFNTKHKEDKYE